MATSSSLASRLFGLCNVDAELYQLTLKRDALIGERDVLAGELNLRRRRLAELEQAHKEGTLKQVMEQHRLRDEQEKILNRRKQLSAVGGAKAAKFMEREIDIASRTLKELEDQAVKALEQVDQIEGQLQEQRDALEKFELEFENFNQKADETIQSVVVDVQKLESERETVSSKLEERLLRLYNRVRARYPGDAVATAADGACQSCNRALPSQTYNQILAGNMLIQCPGCSRILVTSSQSS